MTPNILEVLKWQPKLREFIWFDIGELTDLRHIEVTDTMRKQNEEGVLCLPLYSEHMPEDLPMPFDMFGIVMNTITRKPVMVAATFQREGNDLQVVFWRETGALLEMRQIGAKSAKRDGTPDLVYDGNLMDAIKKSPKYTGSNDADIINSFAENAREMYLLLMMDVLERKKTVPAYRPLSHPSNDKRIRKGKKPIFEWKVIDITAKHVMPENSAPTGRKQASPRRHVRRGHQRTLANGKKIWIKQMMVGKIEFGYIHHSYTTQGERR
jgi:hypothetical protein